MMTPGVHDQRVKPYVRWWWLEGPFREEEIRAQLEWIQAQGFGGVELAWVWPGWYGRPIDEVTIPGWLSHRWSQLVQLTKQSADDLGLGCDFTFGSCWPFGGSGIPEEYASKTFSGLSRQRLRGSWERSTSHDLFVLDHLDREALSAYAEKLLPAFAPALAGTPSALFCDSLELGAEWVWHPRLWDRFAEEFGYRLEDFVDDLDQHPDVRYDYRKLVAGEMLQEFYVAFAELCRHHASVSRVQCHGSPTDLLAAYGAVDIPESEALLFEPHFSRIPASAAALTGSTVVSCETFTCIYGFATRRNLKPLQFVKQEQLQDLKLLADAVFTNGVNHIIWHGMPYNPPGGQNAFYASVHVGPDAAFVRELPAFNRYLEEVSQVLQQGRTQSHLAMYLPLEDHWMRGMMPIEQRHPGALFEWELRHVVVPESTRCYNPLWITLPFLRRARWCDGRLTVGSQQFQALYIDVAWMDGDVLPELLRLAGEGLPIILARQPALPGRKPNPEFGRQLRELVSRPNVAPHLARASVTPLALGAQVPPFWVRESPEATWFFFAHSAAAGVSYPMEHGYGNRCRPHQCQISLQTRYHQASTVLEFGRGSSFLVCIDHNGRLEQKRFDLSIAPD